MLNRGTYFDPIFSVGRQGGQATTRSASTSGFKWVLIDLNTTPDTPKPPKTTTTVATTKIIPTTTKIPRLYILGLPLQLIQTTAK